MRTSTLGRVDRRLAGASRMRDLMAVFVLVVCGSALTACGSGGGSLAQYRTPTDLSQNATIVVHANQIGAPVRINIRQGEIAFIRVISDTSGRVGLAGYDTISQVSPQKPAVLAFSADYAGTFPIVARFGASEREIGVASIK